MPVKQYKYAREGFSGYASYSVSYYLQGGHHKIVMFDTIEEANDFIGCALRVGGYDWLELSGFVRCETRGWFYEDLISFGHNFDW